MDLVMGERQALWRFDPATNKVAQQVTESARNTR